MNEKEQYLTCKKNYEEKKRDLSEKVDHFLNGKLCKSKLRAMDSDRMERLDREFANTHKSIIDQVEKAKFEFEKTENNFIANVLNTMDNSTREYYENQLKDSSNNSDSIRSDLILIGMSTL